MHTYGHKTIRVHTHVQTYIRSFAHTLRTSLFGKKKEADLKRGKRRTFQNKMNDGITSPIEFMRKKMRKKNEKTFGGKKVLAHLVHMASKMRTPS